MKGEKACGRDREEEQMGKVTKCDTVKEKARQEERLRWICE